MDTCIRQRFKQFEAQKGKLRHKLLKVTTENDDIDDGQLVTPARCSIVSMDPMCLVEKLKNGDLSATIVLQAFQAKALEVTERINCITEFIPEADAWAVGLDLLDPSERLPLHGLPVSIKECVNIRGCDTTIGLAKHLYCPVGDHAVLVKTLLAKGAVPFCRTNVPQTMLSYCCTNPVFGMTTHPEDPTRSPGGSSGGEGALIAAGGSILGIGTDLAGSVRVPAAFSGCVGLKPTWGRLSSKGVMKALEGMVGNVSTPGILGRDVSIVCYATQVLLSDNTMVEMDSALIPVPWYPQRCQDTKKLTIGWYDSFDILPTTPGLRRAVMEARDALASCGHTMVPFTPPDVDTMISTVIKIITADGGRTLTRHIEGEHIDPSVSIGIKSATWSRLRKRYEKFMMQRKSEFLPQLIQTECEESHELWAYLTKRKEYIYKFNRLCQERGITLLLGPVFMYPAPQHIVPASTPPACLYSVIYNYCDFPAISLPISRENADDQRKLETYPENDLMLRIVKNATKGATGLPLSVQLVGFPWQEEVVCRVAKELESVVGPLTPREKP